MSNEFFVMLIFDILFSSVTTKLVKFNLYLQYLYILYKLLHLWIMVLWISSVTDFWTDNFNSESVGLDKALNPALIAAELYFNWKFGSMAIELQLDPYTPKNCFYCAQIN